jgi:hypothetical protein
MGNCLSLSYRNIDQNSNPVLFCLGTAFEKLRICHDSSNENFLKSTPLFNPLIFRGPRDKAVLDPEYLDCEDDLPLCRKIANLKMEDCFGVNGLLTRVEIRQNCGIDFSVRGYANFGRAVTHFVNRLSINRINDGSTVSLRESLNIKKPGPKIRALMVKRRKKPFDLGKQRTVKTFFRITGIQYVGNELFSKIVAVWTEQGFTNRQKSFLFKFFNNILGINTRTSHFAENGTRVCFFCSKKNPPERHDESFIHLFYTCSTVRTWQQQFILRCFPEMGNLDIETEKKLWLTGIYDDSFSHFIFAAFLTFQFFIWENKLRKNVPSFHTIYTEFISNFRDVCKHNSDVRLTGTELNFELCRITFGRRRRLHHE